MPRLMNCKLCQNEQCRRRYIYFLIFFSFVCDVEMNSRSDGYLEMPVVDSEQHSDIFSKISIKFASAMVWSKSSAPCQWLSCWLLGFTVGLSLWPFDLFVMVVVVRLVAFLADIDQRYVVGQDIWTVSGALVAKLTMIWKRSRLCRYLAFSCSLLYRLDSKHDKFVIRWLLPVVYLSHQHTDASFGADCLI